MTNCFFRPLATLSLIMGLALPAYALEPRGEVYSPEGAPATAPNWRNFYVEPGDDATLSGICTNFLQQAGLANQFGWRDCAGSVIGMPFNSGKINPQNGHLIGDTVIALPVHLTTAGAAEPILSADVTPSAEDVAALLAELREQTAAQADEIAALSAQLATAEASFDTSAIEARIEELAGIIPDVSPLAASIDALEAFVTTLENGEVPEAMLAVFDERVQAALGTLPGDVTALRSDLTALSGRVDTLEAQNSIPVTYGLLIGLVVASVIAALIANWIFGWLPFSFKARTKETLDVHTEMLNGQDQRITAGAGEVAALRDGLEELRKEHDTTRAMVNANAGELARVDDRVTQLGEVVSGVEFDASALKPCNLHAIPLGEPRDLMVYSAADDAMQWLLQIERVEQDSYVIHGIVRREDSTELMPACSAAKVATAIRRAAKGNRLRGAAPQLMNIAAE